MNDIVYDPASANYQINRVSMHFWQDKNLLDKPAGSLAEWLPQETLWDRGTARDTELKQMTVRNEKPVRGWTAELCVHTARDGHWTSWWCHTRAIPMEAGSKFWGHPFLSCFASPYTHWDIGTHKAGSDWRHQHHQFFPLIVTLFPKRILMARVAAKHDRTAPHICITSSFGNSRSKSLILYCCPLNSVPFLRGSSFTSKGQNSTPTVGKALFPRWNQEVWVAALLYQIGSDWLQWSYYWTHNCPVAKQFFSWGKFFNETFSQWKQERSHPGNRRLVWDVDTDGATKGFGGRSG